MFKTQSAAQKSLPQSVMSLFTSQKDAYADGERDHDEHGGDHEERPAQGNPHDPSKERARGAARVLVHIGVAGGSEIQAAAAVVQGNWYGAGNALDLQLAPVATEPDAVDVLHGLWQAGQHRYVRVQFGQAEGGQRGVRSAQRTLQALGLGRLHVDACEALQAERVAALQHFGRVEHVVELTEAHGALQLWEVVVTGHLSYSEIHGARRRLCGRCGLSGAFWCVRILRHGQMRPNCNSIMGRNLTSQWASWEAADGLKNKNKAQFGCINLPWKRIHQKEGAGKFARA